jgi:hypothetical protein
MIKQQGVILINIQIECGPLKIFFELKFLIIFKCFLMLKNY